MATEAWKAKWQTSSAEISSLHPTMQVSISKPEVVGSMLTRYVTYQVHTEPTGYSVRRRWSEFLWLRETLGRAYPGLFIPVLPTNSTFTGGTDVEGELVRSRVSLLSIFMNQLFAIPFLLSDSTINSFLSILGDREFKAFVDNVNKSTLCEGPIAGVVAWRNMLDDLTTVAAPEQYSEELKKYLDTLKVAFIQLQDHCAASIKGSQVFYNLMSTTTSGFGIWADAECSTAEMPAEGNMYRPADIKKLSDAVVVSLGHWGISVHNNFKILDAIGLMIQEQLAQVEGFREHLRQRDNLNVLLEKTEKERTKLLEDKSKAAAAAASGSKGFMSRFSKSDADLNELYNKKDEQVMQLAEQLKRFNRALHFCEIIRFQEQRSKTVTQLLGIIISCNVQAQEKSIARWIEISSLAGLDINEFSEQATVIMSDGAEVQAIGGSGAALAASAGNIVAPAEVYLSVDVEKSNETMADV